MINAEEFTKRLQKVMDYYEETASSFAVKIDVQRSSISHILSGRNKPSLDFVMKVLHAYPEVELYWLINGKGNFPNQKKIEPLLQKATLEKSETFIPSPQATKDSENSKIERIVIFYKDGSFKSYEN
jgi:transcriptional regulator with XRE-family HTH domain